MHASVFLFGLWGNYIFFCTTTCDFLREDWFSCLFFSLFFVVADLLNCLNKVIAQDFFFFPTVSVWWHDLYSSARIRIVEFSPERRLKKKWQERCPLMQIMQYKWQIQIREESNGSTALFFFFFFFCPLLPRAHADGINLTWWSLRPRTILNNQPRQSDRLIYREHDTDVTALFIFSLCQWIKMQGAFAVPR